MFLRERATAVIKDINNEGQASKESRQINQFDNGDFAMKIVFELT